LQVVNLGSSLVKFTRRPFAHLVLQIPCMNDGNCHQEFTVIMDQTPVYHSIHKDITIERIGASTVNMRSSANANHCVNVAVENTAAEKRVSLMVVFKGKLLFCVTKIKQYMNCSPFALRRVCYFSWKRGRLSNDVSCTPSPQARAQSTSTSTSQRHGFQRASCSRGWWNTLQPTLRQHHLAVTISFVDIVQLHDSPPPLQNQDR